MARHLLCVLDDVTLEKARHFFSGRCTTARRLPRGGGNGKRDVVCCVCCGTVVGVCLCVDESTIPSFDDSFDSSSIPSVNGDMDTYTTGSAIIIYI
jgi:hypothetical protein